MRRDRRIAPKAWLVGVLLAGSVSTQALSQWPRGTRPIAWKSAERVDKATVRANKDARAVLGKEGKRHTVVQLSKIPTRGEREAMEAAGVKVLNYLGNNAHFAKVDGGDRLGQ